MKACSLKQSAALLKKNACVLLLIDFVVAQRIWKTEYPLRLGFLQTQLWNRSTQSGATCELLWLSHSLLWSEGVSTLDQKGQTASRTLAIPLEAGADKEMQYVNMI